MTRTKLVLTRRWRWFAVGAALLILGGAVLVVWLRVDKTTDRAAGLAAEADRRGEAVQTLAGDVRVLRGQLQASGETPAAPDPARAVEDLSERAEVPVPVPVPGPPGPRGEKGERGEPAPSPSPGQSGAPGDDSTVPGPSGPPGPPGTDGQDGEDGQDGKNGADGADGRAGRPPVSWTWTYQGTDYTCRRAAGFDARAPRYECDASEPAPESPPDEAGLLGMALALDPNRRTYP